MNELAKQKAESRRRDREDIQSGKFTPAEVNARNAWIPNPCDWKVVNLLEATVALGNTKWDDDDGEMGNQGQSSTVVEDRRKD